MIVAASAAVVGASSTESPCALRDHLPDVVIRKFGSIDAHRGDAGPRQPDFVRRDLFGLVAALQLA